MNQRIGGRRQGIAVALAMLGVVGLPASVAAQASPKKPNILVIMGDDIGWF